MPSPLSTLTATPGTSPSLADTLRSVLPRPSSSSPSWVGLNWCADVPPRPAGERLAHAVRKLNLWEWEGITKFTARVGCPRSQRARRPRYVGARIHVLWADDW